MGTPQDAATAAARFGQPAEWGRYHSAGRHVCVDGRNYITSPDSGCLVTDPALERVARYFMTRGSNR